METIGLFGGGGGGGGTGGVAATGGGGGGGGSSFFVCAEARQAVQIATAKNEIFLFINWFYTETVFAADSIKS